MDEGTGEGRRALPEAVWAAVREDFVAGLSASQCCRRHGVSESGLRARAAREGWRRVDQVWTPPNRLDPWDEGVALEEKVGGNVEEVELSELAYIARMRMLRAVLRGDAVEALRWRRVAQAMDQEEADLAWYIEREEARRFRQPGSGSATVDPV